MNESNQRPPDHSLQNASLGSPGVEPPKILAVTDLRAYVKPELGEDLLSGAGAGSSSGIVNQGVTVVCQCVPVETCVCNTVRYYTGATCPCTATTCSCTGTCSCTSTCSCTGTCTCTGTCSITSSHYWRPN